jgi:hypothetical protein
MDIRKNCQQHDFLRGDPIPQAGFQFDGYQTTGGDRRAIG